MKITIEIDESRVKKWGHLIFCFNEIGRPVDIMNPGFIIDFNQDINMKPVILIENDSRGQNGAQT